MKRTNKKSEAAQLLTELTTQLAELRSVITEMTSILDSDADETGDPK